jgi:23S rRNA (uridine2552-2'-O)-methyltransferase
MPRRWLDERRREHYYKKAKKEGLRSRAAYKIIHLNEKFKLIREGDIVLDLGSAPGGWLEAIKNIVGEEGRVIGVDMQSITPIEGVEFILGDITEDETFNKIISIKQNFDVVTSDCSPNVSGNWALDHSRQIYLAQKSLEISERVLKTNGNFIVKVFEGEDLPDFINKIKRTFSRAIISKPKSSRKKSSELYIIGKSFLRKGK